MPDGRPRPRGASTVIKRSVLIAGHPTSVSLEEAFWDGLKAIAAERAVTLTGLLTEIDGGRAAANLSSTIRVFVLGHYRGRTGLPSAEG